MYAIRNKVQLIGSVTGKPILRNTPSGQQMCRFQMETRETVRNHLGEKVSQIQVHKIVSWGKQAAIISKCVDTNLEVAIDGKITYREYTNAAGKKETITEIVVNDFIMLGSAKSKEFVNS